MWAPYIHPLMVYITSDCIYRNWNSRFEQINKVKITSLSPFLFTFYEIYYQLTHSTTLRFSTIESLRVNYHGAFMSAFAFETDHHTLESFLAQKGRCACRFVIIIKEWSAENLKQTINVCDTGYIIIHFLQFTIKRKAAFARILSGKT